MPSYSYIAKSFKGEEKSGVSEAKNKFELARTLRQQGFILVSAVLEEKRAKKRKFKMNFSLFGGVPLTEKLIFTRNLQVMISAGLSLPTALRVLALQSKNEIFKKAILEITEEITQGKSFSESLAKYPNIFSDLYQNMMKIGEESGTLDQVLKSLTQQLEREHELKSRIKGAMIYPTVIVGAMVGIGILMLIIVVPKMAEVYEGLGVELPITTKFVMFLGNFFVEKWFLVILIIFLFAFFSRIILKTKGGKKLIDAIILKIPTISPIVKKTNSARTTRTLGSLIKSGVPLVRSLEILSGTLGNIYFKSAIIESVKKVEKGQKLSEALEPYQNIYPPFVIQMLAVGEETGQTSDILIKLADFFEAEVTNATKNLASVIEPVLILLIGAVVGFFAISMIQPMYSMLGAV